jgi:C-terminal processing protease CtpA/Prc
LNLMDFFNMLSENPHYIKTFNLPFTLAQSQLMLNYYTFIVSEWTEGRSFTKKYPLLGYEKIPVDTTKTPYTKPILVLVNSLDFSCADILPAVFQDNKRAKIMGTRTAGAGGSINTVKFPNRFGIDYFTYTTSIAERLNKQPIENLGVTPDIEYKLKVEDYQNNFKNYASAINAAIEKLVQEKL